LGAALALEKHNHKKHSDEVHSDTCFLWFAQNLTSRMALMCQSCVTSLFGRFGLAAAPTFQEVSHLLKSLVQNVQDGATGHKMLL